SSSCRLVTDRAAPPSGGVFISASSNDQSRQQPGFAHSIAILKRRAPSRMHGVSINHNYMFRSGRLGGRPARPEASTLAAERFTTLPLVRQLPWQGMSVLTATL